MFALPFPMKYIYGPVKSRRLGLSLGITLTPYKICTFDCVYCQLGGTEDKTKEIKEYANIEEILAELKLWLQNNALEAKKINYITLSGSGEPTLNIKIGQLIARIKQITATPIAVITNASILNVPSVRQALSSSDLILPSLDAVSPGVFEKIDQPHNDIKIEDVINGLINLRKDFRGKIWLEVMLVRGINDSLGHIRKLKEIVDRIGPDKIQLNSPVRPIAAASNILCVDKKKLERIKEILGDKAQII